MESWRLAGIESVMSTPSSLMTPADVSSSPAIRRSKVDFRQPDGPTKTTNWPSSIFRLIGGMTVWAPKTLVTFSSTIEPMMKFPLFHGAEGEAAHQLLLAEPAEQQDGRDGEG